MRNTLVLGLLVAVAVVVKISKKKIGPCSPELEDLMNKE